MVFTLYYFYSILDAPWTAKVSTYFVGTILIALIAIFFVISILAARRGEIDWGIQKLISPLPLIPKRITLLAMTLAYIIVIQWAGFTLTSFIFLYSAMLLLGGRKARRIALVLSLLVSLGGYLLFVAAFQTRFPVGPFEQLMKGLF